MRIRITFLLLIASLLGYSQSDYSFFPENYFFQDENEIILPQLDYSSVLVVYQEDITDSGISKFEKLNHSLSYDNNQAFPSNNKRIYVLDKAKRISAADAEAYLAGIRSYHGVLSAYPVFIRDGDKAYLDNIMLVNVNSEIVSRHTMNTIISAFDGQIAEDIELSSTMTYAIAIPADINIFSTCMELAKNDDINYAQPNFYFTARADIIPDDPRFSDQWFLHQSSDADIDAPEAWDITTGSSTLAVAVIDGHGYDLDHIEMEGEYISPYNAVADNSNPLAVESEENHGTPCAGLIGALTNNGMGVAGVGYNTKVVPIKIGFNYGSGGTFSTSELIMIRACEHVMINQNDIVAVSNSYTMGSWANIAVIRDAFTYMRTDSRGGLGCVVLASTGNENTFNSVAYPFHFPHVVGVGATNRFDARSSFSNYGDSTDLVAPGTDIWTIDRSGSAGYTSDDYVEFGGTSAACPIAAGVVALIASVNPTFTWEELQNRLCSTCDKIDSYSFNNNDLYPYSSWNQQVGYGRVNAFEAVQGGAGMNPPTNLTANVTGSDVLLSWTAPSGSGYEEELIYDNNTNTGSYRYPGNTMSTHMSPTGPCQLLTLKYYTTNQGSNGFEAKVFNWAGGQPGTDVLYSSIETAPHEEWMEVDVSGEGINLNGDFLVGFGSVDTMAFLGYDENLDNGRSWDFQESSGPWTEWTEAYLIRAVVLYPGGKIAELGGEMPPIIRQEKNQSARTSIKAETNPVSPIPNQFERLMGFLGYKVYRDGSLLNSNPINTTYYNDNGLTAGTYSYTVTAIYDNGESNPAGPVEAVVSSIVLDPPTNLQSSVNGNKVNLSWSEPAGAAEQWIYYHDGTFEFSISSLDGGAGLAQLFTLSSTPATLEEIRFLTTDYEQWQQSLSVYVLSGDGTTVLGGPYYTNGVQDGWVSIPCTVSLNQSNFMIATYNDLAGGPYVGVDESLFDGTLFFGSHTSGFQDLSQAGGGEGVGSHEAKILYDSKSSRAISEWIRPGSNPKLNSLLVHREKEPLSASYPDAIKALLGYNIYRDGTKVNTNPWTSTAFTESNVPDGSYSYDVTAIYEEGESSGAGPVQLTVNNLGLEVPANLTASVSGDMVSLSWTGPGSSQEELIYDNGPTETAYKFPGFTFSTQMSPAGECKILTLKYLTTIDEGNNSFKARIFNWAGSQPGQTKLYEQTVTAVEGWLEVDISGENITVDGDFMVGFGSTNDFTYQAYDENLNNGRSWDWEESSGSWTTWDEAYIIRAIVEYSDGTKAELGGAKKGLLGYNLYRNNVQVNSSLITGTSTTDILPGWGTYVYNVSAKYDEGESAFSNDASISHYFGIGEEDQIDARIYPNPASQYVFIDSQEDIQMLSLYSIDGKNVLNTEQQGPNIKLDLSGLEAGLYLLKITTDERSGTMKLIIR